jgi:soluble lytic murein transglycosylase-like protein
MGAVRRFGLVLALGLALPRPAAAQGVAVWRPFVTEASSRFGVPVAWIERVMWIESRGRTRIAGRPVISPAGAMGLMQLMPATWVSMRDAAGLGNDPFDPHDNIIAGTLYLRLLYGRFGYPGLFAAYNAGPGRYGLYLAARRALPGETVRYLSAASDLPAPAPGNIVTLFAPRASPGNGATAGSIFAIAPRP